MDISAQEIVFDKNGNCNFCEKYLRSSDRKNPRQRHSRLNLSSLVSEIKKAGRGKDYDCVVGVSGGVDSSWVLVKAVELGLRPLAVHMDNGWNSNLAVSNISNVIDELGLDLYTHVINWEEYRSLMEAFFKADVIDIELLYDNALHEVCYSQAEAYGLKHILSGDNFSTEGLSMPSKWAHESKWDGRNILRIASKYGARVYSFPLFTTLKWLRYTFLKGISWVPLLDYIDFNKEVALGSLESSYGYVRYPYKHYESVFTRFYQGFILPMKFGVDKRRVHLSSLIMSGQLSRDEAAKTLKQPASVSEKDLAADKKFFLKKMNWEESTLEQYLARPGVEHGHYGSDLTRSLLLPLVKLTRRVSSLTRSLGRH